VNLSDSSRQLDKRRRFLVVVRAGDRSLHPQWLSGEPRNWDLALSYYGDFPDRFRGSYEHLHLSRGSKWEGLTDFMRAKHELVHDYEYVWFPDDDLLTTAPIISRFFDICAANQFTVAQPSLDFRSYYSHPITLQRPHCLYRCTDFVEIMAPCFQVANLALFVPTFSVSSSGWGLEWVWWSQAQSLASRCFAIVDETAVQHTRPVGSAGNGGASTSPELEMRSVLAAFGVTRSKPSTPQVVQRHAYIWGSLRYRLRYLMWQTWRFLRHLT
jgi:hypothetical protein